MTKKEVIQNEILLKELEDLKIDNKQLKDRLESSVNMHTESLDINKVLIDLIENKILNIEDIQKREGLYLEYFNFVEKSFIYKLFFGKKHLELFKQLKNTFDGN
jgi:hypothetical protein